MPEELNPPAPRLLPDGSLAAPDGVVDRRTPQRVSRRLGREQIAAGAAVVTDLYPEGLLWHSGESATRTWQEVASRLVTGPRPLGPNLNWVGHVWRSDDGEILLRFDGEGCL